MSLRATILARLASYSQHSSDTTCHTPVLKSTELRPSGEGRENRPVGKKRVGRGWAERPDGPKDEENYFRIKFWIFEYTKSLEICTRKFRRNFDMRIFPKFS
jgi:hypothetical protein